MNDYYERAFFATVNVIGFALLQVLMSGGEAITGTGLVVGAVAWCLGVWAAHALLGSRRP